MLVSTTRSRAHSKSHSSLAQVSWCFDNRSFNRRRATGARTRTGGFWFRNRRPCRSRWPCTGHSWRIGNCRDSPVGALASSSYLACCQYVRAILIGLNVASSGSPRRHAPSSVIWVWVALRCATGGRRCALGHRIVSTIIVSAASPRDDAHANWKSRVICLSSGMP